MIDTILFGVHFGNNGECHGLTCINVPGLFTFSDSHDDYVDNIREALSCYDDLDQDIINITHTDVEDLDSEDYDCFIVFFRSVESIKTYSNAADCSYMFDPATDKEDLWVAPAGKQRGDLVSSAPTPDDESVITNYIKKINDHTFIRVVRHQQQNVVFFIDTTEPEANFRVLALHNCLLNALGSKDPINIALNYIPTETVNQIVELINTLSENNFSRDYLDENFDIFTGEMFQEMLNQPK